MPITNYFKDTTGKTSFRDILSGEGAFYKKSFCSEIMEEEARAKTTLPPSYTCEFESKMMRIAKLILSIIIFPIGIYRCLHALTGRIIVPSSLWVNDQNAKREMFLTQPQPMLPWRFKRFTVEVDGDKIDCYIAGTESTLSNGRWVLFSVGNCGLYENILASGSTSRNYQLLRRLKANAILFNYPRVGVSSGQPTRQQLVKAYRAMLTLLEDQKQGIGAKEIIGYGYSLGGAVQGEALKDHTLKKYIHYVFVKDRTFSDLMAVPKKILGFVAKLLGYNMSSVASSEKLQAPEVIIQSAKRLGPIVRSDQVIDDGVISVKASLAKALLDDPHCPKKNKTFFGVPVGHSDNSINDTQKDLKKVVHDWNWRTVFLAEKIKEYLRLQPKKQKIYRKTSRVSKEV